VQGDTIEFPDSWLAVLQPRRSGRRGRSYEVTDDDVGSVASARRAYESAISAILDNPLSDPELVERARCDTTTVETVGARISIDSQIIRRVSPVLRAEECVRLLGLPAAVAACVASAGGRVAHTNPLARGGWEWALISTVPAAGPDVVPNNLWRVRYGGLLDPLRRLLSFADEATWQAAVDQLEPFRNGPWAQRLATSFLIPDRHDWVLADIADLPGHCPWEVRRSFLAYSAFTAAQLADVRTGEFDEIVTMIDAIGHEATPILFRSLDWAAYDADLRKCLLDVLGHLGSYDVLQGLLSRADTADIPAAFEAAARGNPELALETLLRRTGDPFVPALLARQRRTFPDIDGMPADARPPAAIPETLPTILTSPPWTRPRAKPVSIEAPDISVEISWLDGERDEWNHDGWPSFEETHYDYAERPDSARFYLGGSEAAVRPRLATWEAERASFYLENPKLLVAKYELDAYPPVLRLARSKPALGAELLLPYLSSDVAKLMGRWLAGSRQFRPVAQQWFDRHGPAAVTALIPIALGRPTAEGRAAALALSRLDPDLVRAAGRQLDCVHHVDALLARDPLDAVPPKVPEIPSWLDLGLLPPVITRDGKHALGTVETDVLCRMIAMSQLDDPYPGLAVIAGAFDAGSLDAFSWALFSEWHIAGRPGKDLWAMDAIGYFGGAPAIEGLASLVRGWPSEGAAQRAKRGADALGANQSTAALRELSSIARNAKSTPLRQHAAQVLDRVAADRGLLPEQLDDLLAPDLGLDGDSITYQGAVYTPDVGAKLDLVLRASGGRTVVTLPKPAHDDEKATQSEWNKRRRRATAGIADQVRRMEEALIVQRRWSVSDFTTTVSAHPLLRRLAQRLVWSTGGKLAVVDDLGDLVDKDGGLLDVGEWVQLAHPATADLEPWRARMHERGMGQPFEQLDRTVHDGDPSHYWGEVVGAASLFTLVRRGWHWGASGRAATRSEVFRPFGAEGSVVVHFSPGISAVRDPATEPDQTIEEVSLQSPTHGDLAVFGDLPRVTRSELLRDLARLERR